MVGGMDAASLDCGNKDVPSVRQKIFVTFHLWKVKVKTAYLVIVTMKIYWLIQAWNQTILLF